MTTDIKILLCIYTVITVCIVIIFGIEDPNAGFFSGVHYERDYAAAITKGQDRMYFLGLMVSHWSNIAVQIIIFSLIATILYLGSKPYLLGITRKCYSEHAYNTNETE